MKFSELIKKRRSIKKFRLDKKPDWRKILRAIDAARFIPAAGNQYNLKFIVVSDKDVISQLAEASQQAYVKDVSYVVVCVSDPSVLTQLYGEIGERFTAQQSGAAIENFLLALTGEGLATTWVGYFYEDMVKSLLKIPEEMVIEAFFPIGIEGAHSSTKRALKADLDNLVYFHKWGNQLMEPRTRISADSS